MESSVTIPLAHYEQLKAIQDCFNENLKDGGDLTGIYVQSGYGYTTYYVKKNSVIIEELSKYNESLRDEVSKLKSEIFELKKKGIK